MWYAQRQLLGSDDTTTDWQRLPGGPWPHQERAKAACKADLEAHRHNGHRLAYRIVRAHAPTRVDAESHPPHGWRMRWRIPDTPQTPRPKEA
ncbi:hypothetical protein [Halomonas sp. C05BenzN]|uniref:hypothetical protein n=1 Tax=Halomonas sp. C05BenzN TaxID=3411041 RepID=UPI003B965864